MLFDTIRQLLNCIDRTLDLFTSHITNFVACMPGSNDVARYSQQVINHTECTVKLYHVAFTIVIGIYDQYICCLIRLFNASKTRSTGFHITNTQQHNHIGHQVFHYETTSVKCCEESQKLRRNKGKRDNSHGARIKNNTATVANINRAIYSSLTFVDLQNIATILEQIAYRRHCQTTRGIMYTRHQKHTAISWYTILLLSKVRSTLRTWRDLLFSLVSRRIIGEGAKRVVR